MHGMFCHGCASAYKAGGWLQVGEGGGANESVSQDLMKCLTETLCLQTCPAMLSDLNLS